MFKKKYIREISKLLNLSLEKFRGIASISFIIIFQINFSLLSKTRGNRFDHRILFKACEIDFDTVHSKSVQHFMNQRIISFRFKVI